MAIISVALASAFILPRRGGGGGGCLVATVSYGLGVKQGGEPGPTTLSVPLTFYIPPRHGREIYNTQIKAVKFVYLLAVNQAPIDLLTA